MNSQKRCPKCDAVLPENESAGLCVACLLAVGLSTEEISPGGMDAKMASSPADSVSEQAGERIGRYKLLQKIGEGGCGVVYLAEQVEPVIRRVALKVIKPGMDTREVLARFEAERQALALMEHPHIARVLDAGATAAGRPFFVMELVRGIPLTRYCDENELSTKQRLELFIQVCQAIQHAHQKGIIHRDIKPTNVLVADHDGVAVPKIIDFGIAKATSDQKLTDKTVFTALEQFLGTPAYMSPEQAKLSGLDIDTRSDIYSLGVLLYELLTGKTPFDAKRLRESGFDEIRRIIREVEPPRPSLKLSTLAAAEQTSTAKQRQTDSPRLIHIVRGDLDWIVMKCLEKDRNRRYETANGLAMELARFLNCEPIAARPPGRLYLFQKFVRRNKLAVAAGSAVVVALCAGIAGSTWQAIRAIKAEQIASQQKLRAENEAGHAQRQTEAAQKAEGEKSGALETMRIRAAEDYFQEDTPVALAYLARVLRDDPSNHVAAERLLSALTYRNFAIPQTEPLRHGAKVNTVEFSPDGTQVVTASDDGTAQVWNAATGKRIGPPFRHQKAVRTAEFSPDGKLVVTASEDGTAGIWTVGSTNPIGILLHVTTNLLTVAHFSPDGNLIATAADDGTAIIWNVNTGEKLLKLAGHASIISAAAFSPDGKFLLTGSYDQTARLWDLQNGKQMFEPCMHDHIIYAISFAPDGKTFVTACWDLNAYVWETSTGKLLHKLVGHSAVPFATQFSSDGRWILTAAKDTKVKIWDADTGLLKTTVSMKTSVPCAHFSPDGNYFAATSAQGLVTIWSTFTGQPFIEAITHPDKVWSAAFSPQGDRLVTACADGAARVWKLSTGKSPVLVLAHDLDGKTNAVFDAVFNPDGSKVVTGANDGMARIWDAHTALLQITLAGQGGPVRCVRFSPDGQLLAIGSRPFQGGDGSAKIWNLQYAEGPGGSSTVSEHFMAEFTGETDELEFNPDGSLLLCGGAGPLRLVGLANSGSLIKSSPEFGNAASVAFSPDGARFAATSDGDAAYVFNLPIDQTLISLEHREKTDRVRFAPDGSCLATASWDSTARLWNPTNGALLHPALRHDGALFDVEFSPDSRSLVTASYDSTARIWGVANGLALTDPLRHLKPVLSAQFSPDGLLVATTSRDATARLWDAKTGLAVSGPLQHDAPVNIARFSPDGRVLLTASDDGTARLWPVIHVSEPVPKWFVELAEALGGQHLNEQGHFEPVDCDRLLAISRLCETNSATDFFSRWGRWFFSDHQTQDPWNFPP